MARVLSIETATSICSVAIHEDGVLLAVEELLRDRSHSAYLNDCIEHLIGVAGLKIRDLDAVAVSKGPGSYTGLRIGTSTAKGLCYALDIPLIAVNTLEAMARDVNRFNDEGALLCPMIDARRMEVYHLIMDHTGHIVHPTRALVVTSDAFDPWLESGDRLWLFGNGANKTKDVLKGRPGIFYIEDVIASATFIGRIAYEHFKKGKFEDVAYFEPFYLKDFIAKKPKKSI
jgi:tRNA threonylcarbamoyladenosine biosynthesis protein TsaB